MTLQQSLQFYEKQASAALRVNDIVERMTQNVYLMADALDQAVDRMTAMWKQTQNTSDAASKMRTPFDTLSKSLGGTALKGVSELTKTLTPQNMVLSLAIGVGWELFGDDIMTLLGPAMTILESFAAVVHSIFEELVPVFAPILWMVGLLSQMLSYMAENMGALLPMVLGLAGAMLFWNMQTVAATIAAGANAAATWLRAAAEMALSGALGLLTAMQGALNAVMNATPMMRLLGFIMLLMGGFAMLIKKTGGVKNAWATVVNAFIDGFNVVAGLLNKFLGTDIELKTHMAMDPIPDEQKDVQANLDLQQQASDYTAAYEMPDYSALTAATPPDYTAAYEMPDYSAMTAQPLRVETLGTVETVAGEVVLSEDTMDAMGLMLAENRTIITLTPSIVINATVREEADIHKIIAAIDRHLDEECQACAEGVHRC